MTSLKEWIDLKIKDGDINYFDYSGFNNIEKIGNGAFGIVNRANWNNGGVKVALKGLLNNSTIDVDQKEKFFKELKLLRQVNTHPNINQFLGVTKDLIHGFYIMVLQYANQGNLREYLEKNFHSLQWKNKIQMALNITCGLKFLHSKQIIHRDLHAKNILVNNGILMIADFGLSKQTSEISSNSVLLGMSAYIDPQCYIKNNYKRNEKSDIYSLGVLFWEISSEKPPFFKIEDYKIIVDIHNGVREIPIKNTPFEYQQLYENCWKEEPNQRPDIDEIYKVLNQLKLKLNNNDQQIEIKISQDFSNNNSVSSAETSYSVDSDLCNLKLPPDNNKNRASIIIGNDDDSCKNMMVHYNLDQMERKAFELYLKLAENKNAKAQCGLGICYAHGIGTNKNEGKAFEWYLKSAENGNAEAQCNLGFCYKNGIGIDKDETKAFEWYLKSAESGNAMAQYSLGACYAYGVGTNKDETKAFEWYLKSAENGDAMAQYNLGYYYDNGVGTGKNEKKAFEWYLKSAKNGDAMAQCNLGFFYGKGIGTDKNETKAFEWLLKSAENGYAMAQFDLGYCYANGIGTDKNKAKSFEWYLKSAKNENSIVQYNLENYYANSIRTDKTEKKTFELFLKLAENGSKKAQYGLSIFYEHGIGTNKNENKASEWLKSAEIGNEMAQKRLGIFYANGIETAANHLNDI